LAEHDCLGAFHTRARTMNSHLAPARAERWSSSSCRPSARTSAPSSTSGGRSEVCFARSAAPTRSCTGMAAQGHGEMAGRVHPAWWRRAGLCASFETRFAKRSRHVVAVMKRATQCRMEYQDLSKFAINLGLFRTAFLLWEKSVYMDFSQVFLSFMLENG